MQRQAVDWRRLWPFLIGAVLGAILGAQFVITLPEAWLRVALGLFMLVVVFVRIPRLGSMGRMGFGIAGIVTTFLSMFVGATGPISVAIFSKTFDDRVALVATLAAANAAQHALKFVVFFAIGVALSAYLPLIFAMLLTGFAGTLVGTAFLKRLPERLFRRILTVVLTVIALDLLRRGVPALL